MSTLSPDVTTNNNTYKQRREKSTHMCSECGKTFCSHSAMKRHKCFYIKEQTCDLVNAKEKQYSCDQCGKTFAARSGMKMHKFRVHKTEKTYSCEHCLKTFAWRGDLKRHSVVHTGEKRYSCEHCSKKFSHSADLTRHTRLHTGDKRYSCEYCGKTLTDACGLKRHKRRHTGEKPYSCEICGRSFSRSYTLKTHQVVHTGEKTHVCEYCGDTFTQATGLRGHLRIHTGEKPFVCKICGKSFAFLSSCQKHKCIGKKPFSCHNCGERFTKLKLRRSHECPYKGKRWDDPSQQGVHHSHHTAPVTFLSGQNKLENKKKTLVSNSQRNPNKRRSSPMSTKRASSACARSPEKQNQRKSRKATKTRSRDEDFLDKLLSDEENCGNSKFTFMYFKEESPSVPGEQSSNAEQNVVTCVDEKCQLILKNTVNHGAQYTPTPAATEGNTNTVPFTPIEMVKEENITVDDCEKENENADLNELYGTQLAALFLGNI